MNLLELIALAGGLYVPLVFWHFIADWLTQTEKAAQEKSHNKGILARHCAIYTIFFIPFIYIYDLGLVFGLLCGLILYGSHFLGDTYLPVFWWAKYIRKMTYAAHPDIKIRVTKPDQVFGDGQFIDRGMLFKPSLILTIDQLWHLTFLWVIPILAIVRMIYA
jgi:hypothetical protein